MEKLWKNLEKLELFECYDIDKFVRYRRIPGGLLLTEKIISCNACSSMFIPIEPWRDYFYKLRIKKAHHVL
jgi:hypothetical protein